MHCKCPMGKDFVAEFNVKLIDKPAAGQSYGISMCGSDSESLYVVVDAASKSFQLRESGSSKPIKQAVLPEPFTLDVWHTIVVEKRGNHLTAYFDGMRKIDAEIEAEGTAFGFVTTNCRADFSWCGFSNL